MTPLSPFNDPEIQLRIPAGDEDEPEVSLVVPALNEELTIGEFVDWCQEGLKRACVRGEILIIDSGKDRTAELALQKGARVLRTPKRGLGRAYIDALPFIRGKLVIMGDCDCTYDFRLIEPFIQKYREGYEFIMGSRFQGFIEPGSMPPLHRYLGTPVTTWILNRIYGSRFSDIHCGMRAITLAGLERMGLGSQSWEYASEMVLKSVHMKLRTAEVPIHFLKDKEGRLSHHRRMGWFSPWQAAWINLRAMFIYGAEFFLFRPGIALLFLGLIMTVPLSLGPLTVGPVQFSLYWMLLGVCFTVVGLQCFYMGILAKVFFDYSGSTAKRWLGRFAYTRTVLASVALFLVGVGMAGILAIQYVHNGFRLLTLHEPSSYLAVTGLMLMTAGFMSFTFTLLLHASQVAVRQGNAA